MKTSKEKEIEFYKGLARKIKPLGFRCFLHERNGSVYFYVIISNDTWLTVFDEGQGSYGAIYYKSVYGKVTSQTLLVPERFGERLCRWHNVNNP